jgi:hypothetical protein
LPLREITLMGDTAYTVLERGLHAQATHVTLVTTGRVDAVLHEPAPERPQNTIGRPRVTGRRVPALDHVLQNPETVWQELTVHWSGQGKRPLQMCTGTALWDRSGDDPLPIRWVLTRDPVGTRPAHAIFSTDPTQTAEESIMDCLKRWSLDVSFEEGRAHLGMETQRQWSDLATRRSTPFLFGLSSLVALFGRALHPNGQIPIAQAAWSRTHTATFRDVLAAVRRHLWEHETLYTSPTDPAVVFVPSSTFESLCSAVCS